MKKIVLLSTMSAVLLLTATMCGRDKSGDDAAQLIVGKWEYQLSTRVRINNSDTTIADTTKEEQSNLTLEIREIKADGTVTQYSERNGLSVERYVETWDWSLSTDGCTLYLTNWRDNTGNEKGRIDQSEEVLTLNRSQLITRHRSSTPQYTFEWTTTYSRR